MKYNEDYIITELRKVIEQIEHFPTQQELIQQNMCGLVGGINKFGGLNKFKTLMGYELKKLPGGYWTEEKCIEEIKKVIKAISHFPRQKDLNEMNRSDLTNAIRVNGGINKFRELMGYGYIKVPKGKWTDESCTACIKNIINKIRHFPSLKEIDEFGDVGLYNGICRCGGINKFRKEIGYDFDKKPSNYWNDDTIISELEQLLNKIGHFPTAPELNELNMSSISHAMVRHGGINKFRRMFGYKLLQKTEYWTDDILKSELTKIIDEIKHFPTGSELYELHRSDIVRQINSRGGMCAVRKVMGYPSIDFDDIRAYYSRKGKKAEDILIEILMSYSIQKGIPSPKKNVKLNKRRIIEFVCDTSKKIGIDITTTKRKEHVSEKWSTKKYHEYLDELWVVTTFKGFTDADFVLWNKESPENVKIMDIYILCNELQYDLDESLKHKIDNISTCTFHNKESFKK